MLFRTVADLKEKFPNVKVVGGINGLREDALIKNVTMIERTKTEELPEHISPPNDQLLIKILNHHEAVIVRTRDGTIPSAPNYITFAIHIGSDDTSKSNIIFTALIHKAEYNKACIPNQSPVLLSRRSPANSIVNSVVNVVSVRCIHNVEDIDKAKLLLALYDWANSQGPENTDPILRAISLITCSENNGRLSKAKLYIESKHTFFDKVDLGGGLRLLEIDMSETEIDFSKYEAQHGIGKAVEIIKELRKASKAKSKKCVIC